MFVYCDVLLLFPWCLIHNLLYTNVRLFHCWHEIPAIFCFHWAYRMHSIYQRKWEKPVEKCDKNNCFYMTNVICAWLTRKQSTTWSVRNRQIKHYNNTSTILHSSAFITHHRRDWIYTQSLTQVLAHVYTQSHLKFNIRAIQPNKDSRSWPSNFVRENSATRAAFFKVCAFSYIPHKRVRYQRAQWPIMTLSSESFRNDGYN